MEIQQLELERIHELEPLFLELQKHEKLSDPDRRVDSAVSKEYLDLIGGMIAKYKGAIFVANNPNETHQNQFVGFICGWEEAEVINATPFFYISDLVIDPNFRGQGLGTELIRTIESHAQAKGYKRILIEALSGNYIPMDLYRKLGFREYNVKFIKELP
jgi:ribosomal protein S18 acetylase RimI-like enzyme